MALSKQSDVKECSIGAFPCVTYQTSCSCNVVYLHYSDLFPQLFQCWMSCEGAMEVPLGKATRNDSCCRCWSYDDVCKSVKKKFFQMFIRFEKIQTRACNAMSDIARVRVVKRDLNNSWLIGTDGLRTYRRKWQKSHIVKKPSLGPAITHWVHDSNGSISQICDQRFFDWQQLRLWIITQRESGSNTYFVKVNIE